MTTRALIALGIGQCINWGVLYYAFAVLVIPLGRELHVPTWVVTGAFSLALLMSAAVAPRVGRWCDRGRGPVVMQTGGFTAAVLLAAWSVTGGAPALFLIWSALGLCMAAMLYEPAFVIVGRTYGNSAERLRALALITVCGGLASTVFLPTTAFLVTTFGWRIAVLCLAIILALSTWLTARVVFRELPGHATAPVLSVTAQTAVYPANRFSFTAFAGAFTLATLAGAALMTNLVPALGERGVPPGTAALVGGLMGAMQVPGRALLMNGRLAGSPTLLLAISLLLHGAGLATIAFASSPAAIAAGATVFAVGAGLITIVRPYLIQSVFGIERAGDLTGRVARNQQLARAVGPVVLALLASRFTYGAGTWRNGAVIRSRRSGDPGSAQRNIDQQTGGHMTKPQPDSNAIRTPEPACCKSTTLRTCCGAETKASCCGPKNPPEVCGCDANRSKRIG